jgi:hypothetical protein
MFISFSNIFIRKNVFVLNTVKIKYSYQSSIRKISCNFNKLKFFIIAQLTTMVVHVKTALSLVADDVFGNYWWYAFNTNVCFRGYVNVATLTFVRRTCKSGIKLCFCGVGALSSVGTFECQAEGAGVVT